MKALKTFGIAFSAFALAGAFTSCGNTGKSNESRDADSLMEVAIVEEEADTVGEEHTDMAYERYQSELSRISQDPRFAVIYADNGKIWYAHLKSDDQPITYTNILSVYDSQSDKTSSVNMNKTDFPDNEVWFQATTENGGKITVIMEEMRNSNGWVEGTSVWTYDTRNGKWYCIAQGVAGAEFVKEGKAVKITEATILNPDEPTALQDYAYSYRTISL